MPPTNNPPRPWADHGVVRDRFVLDEARMAEWIKMAFDIRDRASALARITEIDPLAERIVVDGTAYLIPDECYRKLDNPLPGGHDARSSGD